MFLKWAWSGLREQFLHCGLRKFRHSKSSVYKWYTQLDRRRFVYDTYTTMKATRMRHGWVHMFITHRPTLTLQLHKFDLFKTCRTSSFCTVAWQLTRFQLTRRIARYLADSWASCSDISVPQGSAFRIWGVVESSINTLLQIYWRIWQWKKILKMDWKLTELPPWVWCLLFGTRSINVDVAMYARLYASVVIAMYLCLSVCVCHKSMIDG